MIPPINSMLDFSNRSVIVTGASGEIGRNIAFRFAEAGADVIVHYYRHEEQAKTCVNNIMQLGRKATALQADLRSLEEVVRFFNQVMEAFDQIDVLINNAGVYPVESLIEMTVEQWDQVIDANLRSVFLCTQRAANFMIKAGTGGSIINIATIEATNPALGHTHYNAAKAAVVMHTRSSAYELGAYGIRVNSVSPGLIWREGLDEAWPEGVTRYMKAVPLGRLGTGTDVADACLFLASEGARWITGIDLIVDGGVLASTVY